jgi:hypothetical protein
MALPSPIGDVAGLLADGIGYAGNPKSFTPGAGLLSLAGLIPGAPRSGQAGAVDDLLRKASEGDDEAYRAIRGILDEIDSQESISAAAPYLRRLFPEWTERATPDFGGGDFATGIWRMVHRGDEIHRVPTSDLSARIRKAAVE